MSRNRRVALLLTAAVCASATSLRAQEAQGPRPQTAPGTTDTVTPVPPADPANAPDVAGASSQTGLGEIVVTARRTSENLQTVPIAVTALSGADLARQSIRTVSDLQQTAPNLRIRPANSNPSSAIVTIRGQSQNDTVATLDPAVGTYVDGVYWGRSVGLNVNVVDIATAEVLRGPQGTLFGRNTTGGALNITTNAPRLDRIEGSVGVTLAKFGTMQLAGVLNVPVIEDRVAIRLAAQDSATDGFGLNIDNRQRTDKIHTTTFRGKALFRPVDGLDITLGVETFVLDGRGPGQKLVFASPTSPGNAIVARLSGGRDALSNYLYDGHPYRSNTDTSVPAHARTDTEYATAALKTGLGDLKGTLARRRVYNQYILDFDGTPYPIGSAVSTADTTQWTGEVNLSNSLIDDRLKFILGYFYFKEDGYDTSVTNVLALLNPANNPNTPYGELGTRSNAGYAQASFRVTDRLSATGGIRYTDDRKSFAARTRNGIGTDIARCLVPTSVRPDPAVCFGRFPDTTSSKVNYLASLDYRFSPAFFAYARTATGYRGGGYNLRGAINANVGPLGTFTPFGPENVTDYEIGFKSQLFDNRLRLNAAFFYDTFDDIQRTTVIATPTGGVATYATNAARAKVKGIEVEGTALLTDTIQLNVAGGYTDAGYDRYVDPILGDLSDSDFANTPKYTASVGGQYRRTIALGDLLLRADYSYTSRVNFTGAPDLVRGIPLSRYTSQDGYGLLNLRAALVMLDGQVEVAAFGTNVTNKTYFVSAHEFVTSGLGIVNKIPGRPALYGVELKFNYK